MDIQDMQATCHYRVETIWMNLCLKSVPDEKLMLSTVVLCLFYVIPLVSSAYYH